MRATLADACMCQEYSFTFQVVNGLPPYTWSMSGVVEGLTLDPTTGILSGIPVFADTYQFTISIEDAVGRTDSRDFTLIVQTADVDDCGIEMGVSAVTAFDGTYVDLIWDSPTFFYVDDAFYRIFRNGVQLIQFTQGTNDYRDETVESGQTYTYEVFFHHGSECPSEEEVRAILDTTGAAILDTSGFAILES